MGNDLIGVSGDILVADTPAKRKQTIQITAIVPHNGYDNSQFYFWGVLWIANPTTRIFLSLTCMILDSSHQGAKLSSWKQHWMYNHSDFNFKWRTTNFTIALPDNQLGFWGDVACEVHVKLVFNQYTSWSNHSCSTADAILPSRGSGSGSVESRDKMAQSLWCQRYQCQCQWYIIMS